MKPASFSHFEPTSIPEAVRLLGDHTPDARVLAGGQSLVPMMNFRLARPATLIDLNRISDLAFIRDEGDHLAIGAMTRERTVEHSDVVKLGCPLLHEATRNIGHLPIRTRGTIGGSIANADPAAEYPATVLALDAVLIAQSTRGERRIAAADFFDGVLSTTLEPDEILTEIRIPKMPEGSGAAFIEISRRHGDFALAGIAAQITFDANKVTDVRLAACGVGPGPVRLARAEAEIRMGGVTEETLASAGTMASGEVDPDGDAHATADYRRKLAGVLTRRALIEATERAGETL